MPVAAAGGGSKEGNADRDAQEQGGPRDWYQAFQTGWGQPQSQS